MVLSPSRHLSSSRLHHSEFGLSLSSSPAWELPAVGSVLTVHGTVHHEAECLNVTGFQETFVDLNGIGD